MIVEDHLSLVGLLTVFCNVYVQKQKVSQGKVEEKQRLKEEKEKQRLLAKVCVFRYRIALV